MMGVEDFQVYLQEKFPSVYIPQDLLEIAQGIAMKHPKHQHIDGAVTNNLGGLCVLIDGECCMDRLYGGFFTDWACGGQWNRVIEFLRLLLNTMRSAHMQVVVFFNGAFEEKRLKDWKVQQTANAERVRQILQHVKRKHTPPPKVLWMPPAALRNCIRLILRQLMIPVHMTFEDHKQEVMTFVRERKFDVLLADGAEYLFFDPPRYFSASSLRLTFRGSLDVRELVSEDVAKLVDLHPNRFCLIPAILGNFVLPTEEFGLFYEELLPTATPEERKDIRLVLPAVVAFIRNLPDISDLRAVGNFIFRNEKEKDEKAQRFEDSVHYYMNATAEGFHKYFRPKTVFEIAECSSGEHKFASENEKHTEEEGTGVGDACVASSSSNLLEQCVDSMKLEEEKKQTTDEQENDISGSGELNLSSPGTGSPMMNASGGGILNEDDVASPVSEEHNSCQSASRLGDENDKITSSEENDAVKHFVPKVASEVLRTAAVRHFRGQMHPWIYQVLSKAEVKIEIYVEEGVELPLGWKVWRGIRQSVYALLFDLNHRLFLLHQQKMRHSPSKHKSKTVRDSHREDKSSEEIGMSIKSAMPGEEPGKYPQELSTRLFVKEWVLVPRKNLFDKPELVEAVALPWRRVPTLRRLWFEQQPPFREKRMKAFLSCFLSDTPLMMNQQHVPQHFLILCCILRYMIAYTEHPQRILEMWELNAFLAAAVSPQLKDPSTMQSIPVQNLTIRGVQLSSLFMQGVEHAVLANDACGAPVPWQLFSPWLYFDGKLLQLKLEIANRKRDTIVDLCNGEVDQIAAVERMRQAVLEGLEFLFALPIPGLAMMNPAVADQVHQRLSAVARGRGMIGRREILARGGQLKIGGVVVSQWSGNVDKFQHNQPYIQSLSPEVTSVGHQSQPRGRGNLQSVGVVRLANPNQGFCVNRQPHPYPPQVPYRGQQRAVGMSQGPPHPMVQDRCLSYFPLVGAPISSPPIPPPPPQMGAAGYSLEALQRYQQSSPGNALRGRGRSGLCNTAQRGKPPVVARTVGSAKRSDQGLTAARWNEENDNRLYGGQPMTINPRLFSVPTSAGAWVAHASS